MNGANVKRLGDILLVLDPAIDCQDVADVAKHLAVNGVLATDTLTLEQRALLMVPPAHERRNLRERLSAIAKGEQ